AVGHRPVLAHGGTGCGDRVPAAAEAGQRFAVRLPGLRVLDEVVERVAGIGHLEATVTAPGRAEQLSVRAGLRDGLAACHERRPVLGAIAVARALRRLVVRPEVERLAMRVDEHPAERARTELDDGAAVGSGGGRDREDRRYDKHCGGDRERLDIVHGGESPFQVVKRSVAFLTARTLAVRRLSAQRYVLL